MRHEKESAPSVQGKRASVPKDPPIISQATLTRGYWALSALLIAAMAFVAVSEVAS